MANAVFTETAPTYRARPIRGGDPANQQIRYYDMTSDTGNYTSGGTTITAKSLGLKRIDFVATSGGVATSGTSGATGLGIGITYASDGTSFTVQFYEGSTAGTILGEKTNAEAMPSSHTIRLKVEGI